MYCYSVLSVVRAQVPFLKSEEMVVEGKLKNTSQYGGEDIYKSVDRVQTIKQLMVSLVL